MVITITVLAQKIAALAEVADNPVIAMHDSIPNALAVALRAEGLTVNRGDFAGLTSLTAGIVLVRDSSIINRAITNKRITSAFDFVFLIVFDEESIDGDMEEQFELVRKGQFEFDSPGEFFHFGVWRLTRVWVNQ